LATKRNESDGMQAVQNIKRNNTVVTWQEHNIRISTNLYGVQLDRSRI